MRRLTMILTLLMAHGCAGDSDSTDLELGEHYVKDRAFRRAELERSIVNPDNIYSTQRLENYAVAGTGWDELPSYAPRIRRLTDDDFGTFDDAGRREVTDGGEAPPVLVEWNHDSLMAAGLWMFENFPMAADARLAPAMASGSAAGAIGMWVDGRGRVGGLVATEDGDQEAVAWTCATCHASLDAAGGLVMGRSNADLDSGMLYRLGGRPDAEIDAWGAGRVDSSRDGEDNPTLITDLRPVRHQSYLHHTATLRNGLVSLAIRVETLYIVSQGQKRRPPRELAFALAYYLWNLSDERTAPVAAGRELFERECGACHYADGATADPVVPAQVGTDPSLQHAPGRGTGTYRIPSLVAVADRALLMHDGSVRGLDELLDPQRVVETPGHPFGLELDVNDRQLLLAFVRSL